VTWDELARSLLASGPGQLGIILLMIGAAAKWLAPYVARRVEFEIQRVQQTQEFHEKEQASELLITERRLEQELTAQRENREMTREVFNWMQSQLEVSMKLHPAIAPGVGAQPWLYNPGMDAGVVRL
jgi:lysyl-tRNA synthetase class I